MKYTENLKDVKPKKEALWHCYWARRADEIKRRLLKAGINFTIEQTYDRGASTKGSGYPVKVWIFHVPNLRQIKLAEILNLASRE